MSDKLVSLNAVINIAMQYCPDDDGSCSKADVDMREMLDEMEALSDVPHEMTAIEYEKVKDRMRRSNGTDNAYGLYVHALFKGQIDEAVAIVERWAREHPKGE